MNKFTKELAQELVNKFADGRINPEDVYIKFDTDSPDFFYQVAIEKDSQKPELFNITHGVYRKKDGMGYKNTRYEMTRENLIRYLTSTQGIESIEDNLEGLLEKAIYMD